MSNPANPANPEKVADRAHASYGPGTHELATDNHGTGPRRLLFFAAGPGPDLRWTAESPLRREDGGPDLTGNDGARPAFNGEYSGAGYEFKHFAIQRHGKGINLVTFDGSVRSRRTRDLWRLYWHNQFDITWADRQGPSFFPAWMP